MNFVRRMTAGRGNVSRSDRTTRSESASTISALPSITRRRARRIGTIVSGAYDALSAKQPTTTYTSQTESGTSEGGGLALAGYVVVRGAARECAGPESVIL